MWCETAAKSVSGKIRGAGFRCRGCRLKKTFTEIGKERGWSPVTRAHFDALRSPRGALLVGNPEEVAEKIIRSGEALGGISRVTFQMDCADLPHAKFMQSIELLDTRRAFAPLINESDGRVLFWHTRIRNVFYFKI
jgi:alkanesulfonate monooxygenase SsuD/methylene tetrahydromethanopterin reductase-like flavin-dependent oxidoreductase (luciferase family)